jgi:hypothetical protein
VSKQIFGLYDFENVICAMNLQKLAPIAVKILLQSGSLQKIVANSGTTVVMNAALVLLKIKIKFTPIKFVNLLFTFLL